MMTQPPDQLNITHEEAWAVLPWYITGRLEELESVRVQRHIAACDRCREEVAAQQVLRDAMSEAPTVDYAPQTSLAKLMERVAASEGRRARWRIRIPLPAWGKLWPRHGPEMGPEIGIRPLLVAVGAQSTVIVLLVVLAGWLTIQATTPARFETLTEQSQSVRGSGALVRLVLEDDLSLAHLQAMLRAIDGRIVDGPSAAGVYTVEHGGATPERNEEAAQWLRAQPGVRFAEPVWQGR